MAFLDYTCLFEPPLNSMETYINLICLYAPHAYWIIFCLLMLAGLNIPISEDILLLTGGMLAGTCIPEQKYFLFAWIYAGCWMSAWEAYWVGRLAGPKLYEIKWFSYILTPERIAKLHHYYERFGIFTFIIGRFIPGGVRNALFITSGMGKMPFNKFIVRDGLACLLSSTTIFIIGYLFGENYHLIVQKLETINGILVVLLSVVGISSLAYFVWRRKRARAVL